MSNIYACQGKYAETPFYLESGGIHIFSIEELCYYISENIHILDAGLIDRQLVDWIERECELPELSDHLRNALNRRCAIQELMTIILEYTHYVSAEQISSMTHILDKSASMNDFQKRKLRADYCFRSSHFEKALKMYLQLLSETNKNDFEMAAKLYHNIGTVYAAKFEFEKAADAFLLAYQINGSAESKKSYIIAKKLGISETAYKAFSENHPDWKDDIRQADITVEHCIEKWEKTEEAKSLCELTSGNNRRLDSEYYRIVENSVEKLKIDYRKQYQ